MDLVAAADQEGSLIIWRLGRNAVKNLVVSKVCQLTIPQGTPVFLYFIEKGAKLMVACSTGCILIFSLQFPALQSSPNSSSSSLLRHHYRPYKQQQQSDCQLRLDRTIQIGTSIQSARVMDSLHVMIATTNKLIRLNHSTFDTREYVEIGNGSSIRHFDISVDGKHAIIVADEVYYYNLHDGYCDAHLSAISPIHGMCMTTEYLSFFLSQDRHVEKWVIDWEIECNQKKYFPPLSYHILRDRLQ